MLQGLGAAIMLPASLSLLSHMFPDPGHRARAVAFWAGVVSLAFASGPALGGILTSAFGWRSIFWLNGPVGLLAFGMVLAFVEETKSDNPRRIDWAGQAMVCLVLFSLTFGLIGAGSAGWTAPQVLAAFGLAVIGALAFVRIEWTSRSPVLPRSLFSSPIFSVCVAIGAVLNFGLYGILFIVSIYLQNIRHLSALSAGLMILPFTVVPAVTTRLIVRFSGREYFRARLVVGQVALAVGAGTLGLSLRSTGSWEVLFGLGLLGFGIGCVMPAMTAGVLTSSPAQSSGLASGILNSARQVGGTVGVALMGTLIQGRQEQGYLWSYAVTSVCFLLMAGITMRSIKNGDPDTRHHSS
jgi:DHA2 family methylenomycin A resistance protein-like MFS transporter